ncbi:N-acetyltransferase 10 [Lunasporangiospora selenospora]|uniref:RNA cytidine acetyltransferase n=1 Tax=Lunasporangiospora selenospora TaxID=979761 RepID=A0A9P6KCP5_9FUNG|nr:N-acetyltransferase 10 [Lunasporangiospora selenospora]
MVKKVIDSRIHTLIKNGVQSKHRTFFVIVGDKGKDQVVNLHWLLSQAQVTARPSVLWCYKKELGFSSHRKKREAKIKRDVKRGIREVNEEDPFELFISVTNIRYTYYKETQKILGNTYGMCVLQDFEALTPNMLARTIETVEGGGIIVLLLKSMSSLKQLYTMTMDVHSRYRTESHDDVTARFNERFILSLGSCSSCLVVDDELNVLPISLGKNVKPLPVKTGEEALTDAQRDLVKIKESVQDQQPMGALVGTARTKDQAIAVMKFIEAISEKTLRSTVTLTASRGRGKSAALGIAMASAIAYGYSNIFVTSPSPENLKTLFEFVFKGFDALGYEEHMDYDIVQSTNPAFNNAIVRVNVFKRDHRQTIQYIQPQDAHTLGQAELVVIDEAAAIPLSLVKNLLGPYLVFMASTINGYEGTGRSLSLKLIQQLREQSRGFVGKEANATEMAKNKATGMVGGARTLREIELKEPIRYAPEDPTEKWLNKLLCLDATVIQKNISGCPAKDECQLFYVNRDTLFSYHPVSETFLQRMMALYVASHYKNTPNDLQLLSDAPSHHLFVLLPPIKEGDRSLPDPLCVLQVCLEGEISKQTVLNSLSRGVRASGDLIPWLISQQFQDDDFASLSGARVVRIATHPDYTKMGYGTRALELLSQFYEGQFSMLSEDDKPEHTMSRVNDSELEGATLMTDDIKIRDPKKMPPLLLKLSEKKVEKLHWLGVSYGLTAPLHKFWSKAGYVPVYLRQTTNELTGEHTCVMLKTLESSQVQTQCDPMWLTSFAKDFQHRFQNLLSFQFRSFPARMALSIIESAKTAAAGQDGEKKDDEDQGEMTASMRLVKKMREGQISRETVDLMFSAYDLKRLESYSNQLLDYHVILDLVPPVANLWFEDRIQRADFKLTAVQATLLLALGLQHKTIDDLEKELELSSSQLLALFIKMARKFSDMFKELKTQGYTEDIKDDAAATSAKVSKAAASTKTNKMKRDITRDEQWDPNTEDLDDELGREGRERLRELQRASLGDVEKMYSISKDDSVDWSQAESQVNKKGTSSVVSVRNPESSKKRNLVAGGTVDGLISQEAKDVAKLKATKRSDKRRKI